MNIIMGYHPQDTDKKIYFWNLGNLETWRIDRYAVVETSRGLQVAKVIGRGEIEDEEYATRSVVHFFDTNEDE